jgi:hypothetical protein
MPRELTEVYFEGESYVILVLNMAVTFDINKKDIFSHDWFFVNRSGSFF